MNETAEKRRHLGLGSILRGHPIRLSFHHLAIEVPEEQCDVPALRFLPRVSRLVDVAIAATVAYFWLCL